MVVGVCAVRVEVAAEEGSARAKPLDWDLLRLGLTTLLHFSDTMLRAHLHDNLTFLYTLVSSQAHVCDFISNPKV